MSGSADLMKLRRASSPDTHPEDVTIWVVVAGISYCHKAMGVYGR
jgi:hypothetical protein